MIQPDNSKITAHAKFSELQGITSNSDLSETFNRG